MGVSFSMPSDSSSERSSISFYALEEELLTETLHCHDRNELVLVTKGEGECQLGELETGLGVGFLGYASAGTWHAYWSQHVDRTGEKLSALVVRFPRIVAPEPLLNLEEASGLRLWIERMEHGGFVRLAQYDRIQARMMTIQGARGMLRVARLFALFDLLIQIDGWQVVENQLLGKRERSDRERLKAAISSCRIALLGADSTR